eukprot:3401569-Rhodomonas_salina.1
MPLRFRYAPLLCDAGYQRTVLCCETPSTWDALSYAMCGTDGTDVAYRATKHLVLTWRIWYHRMFTARAVSYTHLRAHETEADL